MAKVKAEKVSAEKEKKVEKKKKRCVDGKHTRYQPTAEEFRCPSCEAGPPDFCVDDVGAVDQGCQTLHQADALICLACGLDILGKVFTAILIKKKALLPCPSCDGSGLVKKVSSVAESMEAEVEVAAEPAGLMLVESSSGAGAGAEAEA